MVYADGSEKHIPADSVDDAFVSRLAEFMRKMTSDMPPRRVPSLAECGWCELTKRRLPRPHGAWTELIHFSPVEHHIANRAHTRLCDGRPASDTAVSSEDWGAVREARKDATLCPDCQDRVNSRDVRSELYGMGRHSIAHLYAVPVLAAFDAIRNCSHCRRNTDDNCKAWREARESVAVLTQEARRFAKGVDELRDATGGRTANIYQFGCGSVAYFAPEAPDFQEAGELNGDALTTVQRVLGARGVAGGKANWPQI